MSSGSILQLISSAIATPGAKTITGDKQAQPCSSSSSCNPQPLPCSCLPCIYLVTASDGGFGGFGGGDFGGGGASGSW